MEAFAEDMKNNFTIVGVGMLLLIGLLVGCARSKNEHARSSYAFPLVSSGALFMTLPPEVQNTIRAQTGGEEIDDIRKTTNSGKVIYSIYFRKSTLYPPLFVSTNGAVLSADHSVAVREPSATLKEIKPEVPAAATP